MCSIYFTLEIKTKTRSVRNIHHNLFVVISLFNVLIFRLEISLKNILKLNIIFHVCNSPASLSVAEFQKILVKHINIDHVKMTYRFKKVIAKTLTK